MRLSDETRGASLGGDGSVSSGPTVAPTITPMKRVGRWTVYQSDNADAKRPFLLTSRTPIPDSHRQELLDFLEQSIDGPVRHIFHGPERPNTQGMTIGFASAQDRILFLLRWSDL